FLMDRIMRKVGLNGRSVVPLISGIACAVPAIMSTRSIENWKDRLITIMVTPLMSCAARLPVYVLLISLVVPDRSLWGIFNLQGLSLLFMYLLGLIAAIAVAYIMKFIIGSRERSYLLMELPIYRMPRWSNIGLTMYERALAFVVQAGKVIIAVSIILWVLATYGPSDRMQAAEARYAAPEMQERYRCGARSHTPCNVPAFQERKPGMPLLKCRNVTRRMRSSTASVPKSSKIPMPEYWER
ncbi:MAG TPA: nucleoside recognition domain-containing protein, partial [Anseongella sp.]|nr:nucleoside recognition domain-containing protein [Anseongella sp.]